MNDKSIDWEELSKLFTVLIVVDEAGDIQYASDIVKSHAATLAKGRYLFDSVKVLRPTAVRSIDLVEEHLGSLFLIQSRGDPFAARGQFIKIWWEGQAVYCFCGSPWLFWMESNCPDIKLGMAAFPPQDAQLDQLFLMNAEQRMVADLEKLNADLKQAKLETEKAQESKNAFFARMSHEMRTPLNGVVSALSLLSDQSLDDNSQRLLSLAQSSSRNLLQVINYILDVSKFEAGDAELELGPLNLPRLLRSVTDVVRARAEERGLELEWRMDESLATNYSGDKTKLRQCLLNLLTNGIKFTRAGIVIVRALPLRDGGGVRFEVEDTGAGISVENREHIFDPFWTGEQQDEDSTGLGLDIVRRNVSLMGGEMGLVSEDGRGSVFWFEIPLAAVDATETRWWSEDTVMEQVPNQFSGAVLLVDDNTTNMLLGRMILESLGVEVDEAHNGAEATDKAINQRYDLVLMDINMPVMDGVEATRRIREHRDSLKLPIVALSAYASSKEEKRCFEAGMNDYLTKPIVRERLAEKLHRWLPVARADDNQLDDTGGTQGSGTLEQISTTLDMTVLDQLQSQIGLDNLNTVIDQFVGEVSDRWNGLTMAFKNEDLDGTVRETHTLASTCKSLGLTKAGDSFSALEQRIRDSGELPTDLEDFDDWLTEGLSALKAYREQQQASEKGSS